MSTPKTFVIHSGERRYEGVGRTKALAKRAAKEKHAAALERLGRGSFVPVIFPMPGGGLLVIHRDEEGTLQQTFYGPTLSGYKPGSSTHGGRDPAAINLEENEARQHLSQLWMDVAAGYDGRNALRPLDEKSHKLAADYLRWQQSFARLIAAGHPPDYAHRHATSVVPATTTPRWE